jgi:hypothetical protein
VVEVDVLGRDHVTITTGNVAGLIAAPVVSVNWRLPPMVIA